MKGFKVLLSIAALLAATLLPVTAQIASAALVHELHGSLRLRGIVSNLDDYRSVWFTPLDNPSTRSYVEQRSRFLYTGKVDENQKVVAQFEIDSRWGDAAYGVGRNQGGALGADHINIETKNLYLDYTVPHTRTNIKAGIQFLGDAFKGVFVLADAAGVLVTSRIGENEGRIGAFRFNDHFVNPSDSPFDANAPVPGKATRDILLLEGHRTVSESLKIGAAYYGVLDDRAAGFTNVIHTLGISGGWVLGRLSLSSFAALQAGKVGAAEQDLLAFAGHLGGRYPVGRGQVRANLLYLSGDGNPGDPDSDRRDFQTILSTGPEHAFFASESLLLFGNKYSLNTYRAVVWDLNNRAQGVATAFVGYDTPLGEKFFAGANLGAAAAAKTNENKPSGTSDSRYLGTEINAEVGYKVSKALTTQLQAGYLFLGRHFDGTALDTPGADPEDPWTARLVVTYIF